MIFTIVLFGLFIACTILFPNEMSFRRTGNFRTMLAAPLGGVMLLCLAAVVFYGRRGTNRLMVFTPETLQSPWLSKPVRWDAVVGYQVCATTRFALQLYLGENEPLPKPDAVFVLQQGKAEAPDDRAGRLGIRGMKADAFSELVGRRCWPCTTRIGG